MPTKQTASSILAGKASSEAKNGGAPSRKIDWTKYGARTKSEDDLTWRPSLEGDTLTGRIQKVAEVATKFGDKIVIELRACSTVIAAGEDEVDGDYSYWPTGGAIDALFGAGADEGDVVTITLTALVDTGKGNPFKAFTVELDDPFK